VAPAHIVLKHNQNQSTTKRLLLTLYIKTDKSLSTGSKIDIQLDYVHVVDQLKQWYKTELI